MARRRFQHGSLFLKGKVWMARWRDDIVQADGRVKRLRRSRVIATLADCPTKKLARRRLETMLANVNSLGYRPQLVSSLRDFIIRWRKEVLSQRKRSTAVAAESHLRCHIVPQLGTLQLEAVNTETVQKFVSYLAVRMTRKTALNVLSTLSAILRTARAWHYQCEPLGWSALALPQAGERTAARFFTADEARRIIAAAPEPFATAFAVAATTAVRPGELFGLKVEDLDFARKLIFVRRSARYSELQTPKTNRSVRALPMPDQLAVRLQRFLLTWRPNAAGLLFATSKATPLSANGIVQRKLWPVLDALKIPRCGLYAFRHGVASLLVEGGAPISTAQAQLGHSDPRVTLGIYSHVIGDAQRLAVSKIADVLDLSGPTKNTLVN